jgi:drug/metabolite transporter superfamily protein YnfA
MKEVLRFVLGALAAIGVFLVLFWFIDHEITVLVSFGITSIAVVSALFHFSK